MGAVAVAAVGVFGVLQMSLMVAQGTGRTIMAEKDKDKAKQSTTVEAKQSQDSAPAEIREHRG